MGNINLLYRRARRIWQTEGFIELARHTIAFILLRSFQHRRYYLTEDSLESTSHLKEADLVPKVGDLTFKIVTSSGEAGQLEAEGYEFRSCPYTFDAGKALDNGAIASCVFVGKELASIGWMALSQQAADCLNEPPMKVDFSSGRDALVGTIWTNPKYRRMGIRVYRVFKMRQYLCDRGIATNRACVPRGNVAALASGAKIGDSIYGEGRYLKILWWKSWKERPLLPGKQGGQWSAMTGLSDLLGRMRRMYQTEGATYLLAVGIRFIAGLFFKYQTFYLIEHNPGQLRRLDEKDFLPKIDHFEWKVVATNQEADELEADGFEFRSYAYTFNARKTLDRGAIASCIFIDRELAHMGWVAMTQEAKDSLNEPPMMVDFAKKEAYRGGVWTNPRYRKLGLHTYGNLKRNLFLADNGAIRVYGQIARRNTASLRVTTKFNPAVYGEGRYLKILWWKSWREKRLTPQQAQRIAQGHE